MIKFTYDINDVVAAERALHMNNTTGDMGCKEHLSEHSNISLNVTDGVSFYKLEDCCCDGYKDKLTKIIDSMN